MNIKVIGDNNYLGDLQEEFFKNRGISNYSDFIKLKGYTPTDPFNFIYIEEAVNFLIENMGCNIGIVVDSDVDGLSSASAVHNYLETYMDYNIKLSIHRKKIHGIKLNELEEDGIIGWANILIVPDAGSEDFEQHKRLKDEYGITTIVIDHHVASKRSEDAYVINNQLDNISVNLTGSAMVYKFLQALDSKLGEDGADEFLDLVAIGLVADMADVRDYEVQSIIRKGIMKIENPFFLNIIESDFMIDENRISPTTLAFSVIPMLNACTRVSEFDEMKIVVEAICNIDIDRVFEYEPSRGKNKGEIIEENLYQHAHRTAKKCKSRQDSMVKKALEGSKRPPKQGLFDYLKENNLIKHEDKVIVINITDFIEDGGLSGLLANKIMYHFNKPTLVLTEKENEYSGSGRGEQIQFFRTKLSESEYIKSAQGHEPAFGVRIDKDIDLTKLTDFLNNYFKDESTEAQHVVDFSIPLEYLEDYMIDDLAKLEEFFGTGLRAPKIYIENIKVKVQDINTGKSNNVLKFTINDIDFVKFRLSAEKIEELVEWKDYMCYNIVATPSINEYDGKRIVQLIIEDIEVVETDEDSSENIVGEEWETNDNEDEINW